MATPQRNYPYENSYISGAVTFNHDEPRFASLVADYDSDDSDEAEVLSQVLPPALHEHQGHAATTLELDVTMDSQDTLFASVESAVAADDAAAFEAADQTLTESFEEAGTATRYSTPAWTGEVGVHEIQTSLHPVPADSQPQAGSSTTTATSSIGPDRSPRRSCREAGRRASQLLYAFYAPASRRKRRASAASSRGGPSASTTPRLRSAPPSVQAPQPTSTTIANGTSTQDENYSEAGSSASPLGKRRRDEVYIKKEEEDSESEDASPSKKARRVRNLRNRSTPARFDSPKVEPKEEPSSPNPFLATPIRKRALKDEDEDEDEDEENQPGPSKRGRFDPEGEPMTPPRTPSPAPALPSLLTAQPSETWSVQAQPSLSMVHTPQDTTGLPTPISTPPPSFVAVLGPMPTQAQAPPAVPPVPAPVPVQPTPLVRTYANIFEWETELPTPTATPPPSFVAVLGPMPTQAEGPPAHPQVPVSDPVEPAPLVRTYAKIFEWERPRRQ